MNRWVVPIPAFLPQRVSQQKVWVRFFWLPRPQWLVEQETVGDRGEDPAHAEGEGAGAEEEELSVELDNHQLLWRLCHPLKVPTDGPAAADLWVNCRGRRPPSASGSPANDPADFSLDCPVGSFCWEQRVEGGEERRRRWGEKTSARPWRLGLLRGRGGKRGGGGAGGRLAEEAGAPGLPGFLGQQHFPRLRLERRGASWAGTGLWRNVRARGGAGKDPAAAKEFEEVAEESREPGHLQLRPQQLHVEVFLFCWFHLWRSVRPTFLLIFKPNFQLGWSKASLLEGKLIVGADLVPGLVLHDLPHLGHRRGGEHVQGVAEEGAGASRLWEYKGINICICLKLEENLMFVLRLSAVFTRVWMLIGVKRWNGVVRRAAPTETNPLIFSSSIWLHRCALADSPTDLKLPTS